VNGKKIKYSDFVQSASLFFALIIAFWIPSYRWVLSDFIVGWLLFSVLEFNFKQRLIGLKNPFARNMFILQLVLFALILSDIIRTGMSPDISKNTLQKLSLLIFPLLFALSGIAFKKKKYLFLKLFVLSNILMSLICLGVALYHSISFPDGKLIFEPHYLSYRSYFTQSDLSVFHHRSYFSMYIVFALAITFYLKEKQNTFNTLLKNILFWCIILFFILMVYLLESRAGVISLAVLLIWQLIYKIMFSENKLLKVLILIPIVLMIYFVFTNKRIQHTIAQITNSEKESKSIAGKNAPERLILWKSATKIISENFLEGIGTEYFHATFNKTYLKYSGVNKKTVEKLNYNVHNQFLEEFVLYGIFGFILLLTLFIYPIIISFKRKNYLFLAFLLITGFNFLFESMLNTIAGIVFFTFFMNYFIFVFNDKQIKNF